MIELRRHALVWLSRPPEAEVEEDRARAADWQASRRPFVVTRRRGPADVVDLGFCVTDARHPQLRPRRVAARTTMDRVDESALPPSLERIAICPAATDGRAEVFNRLLDALRGAGFEPRVYGSWMWQALTGEQHVHQESDLDVLVDVADTAGADCAVALLEREERGLPFKIDGELCFGRRGEVQWREYRQGKSDILLKSIDGMRLIPRAELLS